MDTENFVPSLLLEKVKLSPKHLNKNYKRVIHNVLVKKNEGQCSKHGYIKPNSIEIIQISMGTVETHTLHGYINFMVKFKALVCNPTTGSIIKCKVVNSNNFGVLCASGSVVDNVYTEIIDIIVPKNSLSICSDPSIDMNSLKKNDLVKVEIVGKKFEINDVKISAVGKIISMSADEGDLMIDVDNEDEDDNGIINTEDTYEDDFDVDNMSENGVTIKQGPDSKGKKGSDGMVKKIDVNREEDDEDDEDDENDEDDEDGDNNEDEDGDEERDEEQANNDENEDDEGSTLEQDDNEEEDEDNNDDDDDDDDDGSDDGDEDDIEK